MDKVTQANVSEFASLNDIKGDQSAKFEAYASYCALSAVLEDTLDLETITTRGGEDCALDAIAIVANGNLVTDKSQIGDIIANNKYLDVQFFFVQSTTSATFEAAKIDNFFFGIKDFFKENPRLPANDEIKRAREIKTEIYDSAAYFKRGNPDVFCYYCTTGNWDSQPNAVAREESFVSDLISTNLVERVSVNMLGARDLQQNYRQAKHSLRVEVNIPDVLPLPEIRGVDQSFLGIISGTEYLKIITDEHGNIRRSIFYDNVRDYQGGNKVNQKIDATLKSEEKQSFPIKNNGVTIVAKDLNRVGTKFTLTDYQVVNGCQTSHVIFLNADQIDDSVTIPIRIVSTSDDNVTKNVIEATNSQTEVSDEQIRSLSDFQKVLEDHYETYEGDRKLYYERRSKQYASESGVEKTRIVSVPQQIKAFSAVFLEDPHRASRYYATLRKIHEDTLFDKSHLYEPYYTSSYMAYRLEFLFRNNLLSTGYKAARWHILMAARAISTHTTAIPFLNSRKIKQFCDVILDDMEDIDKASETFSLAATTVETALMAGGKSIERDETRDQDSTDLVKNALKAMLK
ncbi:AIPR family protein [Erythrobacter sp. SD-21]|uniref:AIPR family protein n=1 Tax=Erythrobacter sp. SD-21 TaxID=161528 RepID=UPI000153F140|nr:AIPR family protein [Erythrobacter sp. SD-21]EDL50123.1 hypothetical protein ED21_26668 [Erythrobacter sp. SD-21]